MIFASAAVIAGVVVAQEATGNNDLMQYVNYGVLGLVFLALITNRLALPRERDREAARADKAETENVRLRTKIENDVIPLLTRTVDLVENAERRRTPRD